MTLYRIIRYIFFLIFVGISIGYFIPREYTGIFHPIYNYLDYEYNSIPKRLNVPEHSASDIVNSLSTKIFRPIKVDISQLLDDLTSNFAFDSAIDKDFSDLSYLIETYLTHNEFFEDIVLSYNDRIIYKKNLNMLDSALVFKHQVETRRGIIKIDFVYNIQYLQSYVDRDVHPIILSYNTQFFYMLKYEDILNKVLSYQQQHETEKEFNLDKTYYVYTKTITNDLEHPLELYYLEKKEFNFANILQFFFLMLFPIFCIGLIVLDRKITSMIQQFNIENKHTGFLSQNSIDDESDSLEWLDDFIKQEDKQ